MDNFLEILLQGYLYFQAWTVMSCQHSSNLLDESLIIDQVRTKIRAPWVQIEVQFPIGQIKFQQIYALHHLPTN
jgi:hypothetical protein